MVDEDEEARTVAKGVVAVASRVLSVADIFGLPIGEAVDRVGSYAVDRIAARARRRTLELLQHLREGPCSVDPALFDHRAFELLHDDLVMQDGEGEKALIYAAFLSNLANSDVSPEERDVMVRALRQISAFELGVLAQVVALVEWKEGYARAVVIEEYLDSKPLRAVARGRLQALGLIESTGRAGTGPSELGGRLVKLLRPVIIPEAEETKEKEVSQARAERGS